MVILHNFLWITVLPAFCQAFLCEPNSLTSYPCNNDAVCVRLDPSYTCADGYCCRRTKPCGPNQISINNETCYAISDIGGSCIYSVQCQSPGGAFCKNGVCVPDRLQ
ncbi:hypothetical protein V3C99_016718 [Haemonchus contortus]